MSGKEIELKNGASSMAYNLDKAGGVLNTIASQSFVKAAGMPALTGFAEAAKKIEGIIRMYGALVQSDAQKIAAKIAQIEAADN